MIETVPRCAPAATPVLRVIPSEARNLALDFREFAHGQISSARFLASLGMTRRIGYAVFSQNKFTVHW